MEHGVGRLGKRTDHLFFLDQIDKPPRSVGKPRHPWMQPNHIP
jgi:hypothetical protein